MRLFTALELEAEIVSRLDTLVRQLQPVARLRWSPPENFHITTKFIGEWPVSRIPELRESLPPCLPQPEITVSGVGFFPNSRYPKVLFAHVAPSAELLALACATDRALGEIGIPVEKHRYRPHVTLARIPDAIHLQPLRERLTELNPGLFGSFRATEYALFESRAGRYTRLHSFEVAAR